MAFILGKKTLKDSEEFDSYAYGITLPIQGGNTGFFSQALQTFKCDFSCSRKCENRRSKTKLRKTCKALGAETKLKSSFNCLRNNNKHLEK